MKKILCFIGLLCAFFACAGLSAKSVNWMTNYDDALRLSQESNKPILLLFTGSDWCTWCIKLEEEVLNTSDFADVLSDKLIFVKLDFPRRIQLSADSTARNRKLQKQFNVSGFPSIVLVDSSQRKLGSMGYQAGGGRQYALQLLKMIDDNKNYQQRMSSLKSHTTYSATELKALYEQAMELNYQEDARQIARLGMEGEQSRFFLLESYRELVGKGGEYPKEALALKKRLINEDIYDLHNTQYHIALIELEASCRDPQDENRMIQTVRAIQSLDRKCNAKWLLEMLLAQTYMDRGRGDLALKCMQISYTEAPEALQPALATVIKNMQT